jgi:hypothetical protein
MVFANLDDTTYSRVLLALAIIAAEALLWAGSIRKLFYPALGPEFGFFASLFPRISRGVSDTHCNGSNDPRLHPATLGESADGHGHHSWTYSIAGLSVDAKSHRFKFLAVLPLIIGSVQHCKFLRLSTLTRNQLGTYPRGAWRKRIGAKLGRIKPELRKRMHDPLSQTGQWLKSIVQGLQLLRGTRQHREPIPVPAPVACALVA